MDIPGPTEITLSYMRPLKMSSNLFGIQLGAGGVYFLSLCKAHQLALGDYIPGQIAVRSLRYPGFNYVVPPLQSKYTLYLSNLSSLKCAWVFFKTLQQTSLL